MNVTHTMLTVKRKSEIMAKNIYRSYIWDKKYIIVGSRMDGNRSSRGWTKTKPNRSVNEKENRKMDKYPEKYKWIHTWRLTSDVKRKRPKKYALASWIAVRSDSSILSNSSMAQMPRSASTKAPPSNAISPVTASLLTWRKSTIAEEGLLTKGKPNRGVFENWGNNQPTFSTIHRKRVARRLWRLSHDYL